VPKDFKLIAIKTIETIPCPEPEETLNILCNTFDRVVGKTVVGLVIFKINGLCLPMNACKQYIAKEYDGYSFQN
jgi:hypothetical protein